MLTLTTNEFNISNSYSFAKEIKETEFQHPSHMASFDVKSLYTNIPLHETINICFDQCKKLHLIPHNIPPTTFKAFLELAVKESVFIFNDKLYQQIDAVAMGSLWVQHQQMPFYATMKRNG